MLQEGIHQSGVIINGFARKQHVSYLRFEAFFNEAFRLMTEGI
jgi:hypothetical protein